MTIASEDTQAETAVAIPNNSIPNSILPTLLLQRKTGTNTHR